MRTKRSFGFVFLASVVLLAAVQGCGDDDGGNDKPPVVNPSAGSSGKGNTAGSKSDAGDGPTNGGTGGKGNTGGTNSTGAVGGDDPVDPVGGAGGEGPVQPTCDLPELGEDGCFNCPKNGEVEQWFNRCVDSDCEPFDNEERLPLLKADGTLPTLPN